MPPVEKIKQHKVDPYTIKAEDEDRYDANGNFKSYWADIPDKHKKQKHKLSFVTGYEPLMAKRESEKKSNNLQTEVEDLVRREQ